MTIYNLANCLVWVTKSLPINTTSTNTSTIECAVDGKWTEWRDWEPCSVSCGGGIQMSRRSCANPAPAFGGADCEGDSVRSRSCNKNGCPGKYHKENNHSHFISSVDMEILRNVFPHELLYRLISKSTQRGLFIPKANYVPSANCFG